MIILTIPQIMGQEQSKRQMNAINNNWQPVKSDPHSLFTNVNPYAHRTLRNELTNEEVEEYVLEFSSEEEYKQYMQELRIRMEPSNQQIIRQSNRECYFKLSPFIYTVKYFVNDSMQDMCSTMYKGLLYAHKVDLRLKQINDVPLSDQLYLIKSTLQGFKLLYEKVGYFDIIEQMIFIDKLGRVKVWINPNLSLNHPFHIPKNTLKQASGSQSDMIVKLLDLIEENTDSQHTETIHFRQFLVKKCIFDRLSFYRALEEFQAYCMQEHLIVDENMRSIYELYHQDPNHDIDKSEVQELSMNGGLAMRLQQKQLEIRNNHQANGSVLANPNRPTFYEEQSRKDYRALSSSKVSKQSGQQRQVVYRSYHQKSQNQRKNGQMLQNLRVETPQFRTAVPTLHWRGPSSQQQIYSGQSMEMIHPQNVMIPNQKMRINDQSSRVSSQYGMKSNRKSSCERNQGQLWNDNNNHAAAIRFNYVNQPASSSQQSQSQVPAVFLRSPPVDTRIQLPPRPQTITQQQNRSIFIQPFHPPAAFLPQADYPVKQPVKSDLPKNNLTSIRNPANFVTLNTLNSQNNDSSPNLEELNLQQNGQGKSLISYYSSNQIYTLDKEIADDLQKFLGYSQT